MDGEAWLKGRSKTKRDQKKLKADPKSRMPRDQDSRHAPHLRRRKLMALNKTKCPKGRIHTQATADWMKRT